MINENFKFNFYDFSTSLRDRIFNIDDSTVIEELSIQMILDIKYDVKDSLENISDFILDLDPAVNIVKILFECSIDKDKLVKVGNCYKELKMDNQIIFNNNFEDDSYEINYNNLIEKIKEVIYK